jgi:hypothetical protein
MFPEGWRGKQLSVFRPKSKAKRKAHRIRSRKFSLQNIRDEAIDSPIGIFHQVER